VLSAQVTRTSEASLVAIAQQLAWLGASCGLQPEPSQGGPTYRDTTWEWDPHEQNLFRISYTNASFDTDDDVPPWSSLLGIISVATGFEIPGHKKHQPRLVVPTSLLAEWDEIPPGAENAAPHLVLDDALTKRLQTLTSNIQSARILISLESICKTSRESLSLEKQLSLLGSSLQQIISNPLAEEFVVLSSDGIPWINRLKALAEDYTQVSWDWWPLSPRIPGLSQDQRHLRWTVSALCSSLDIGLERCWQFFNSSAVITYTKYSQQRKPESSPDGWRTSNLRRAHILPPPTTANRQRTSVTHHQLPRSREGHQHRAFP
jgi:hypothetical protein